MKITEAYINDNNDLIINSWCYDHILFYSLTKGKLNRCFPIEDIVGKSILSISNEDKLTTVIQLTDDYSLLIKLSN